MQPISHQEYYDRLFCAALDGTFPSISQDAGTCVYDDGAGHNCAIGLIHPEPKRLPQNKSVYTLADEDTEMLCKATGFTLGQLRRIQRMHDTNAWGVRPMGSKIRTNPRFAEDFLYELNNYEHFGDISRLAGTLDRSVNPQRHQSQ